MKRLYIFLVISVLTAVCLGQGYNYQPWQPSMGPLNFNTLGDAQHPYVQCKFSSTYNNPTTIGINGSGAVSSHAIITSNTPDPCRCYGTGLNNTAPYIQENYLPPLWNGDATQHLDTAIRIGCGTMNNICLSASQIEYWFYPDKDNSTLLVMFSFAILNKTNGHGDGSSCGSIRNPQFYIEVYDGETGQLLNLGYYPTKASQQSDNPVPNYNWPYSRFLAWPSGSPECTQGDSENPPDDYGIPTYYWNGQNQYGYATPTTFAYRECPASQVSSYTEGYPVKWFEYKPLAFNLRNQAAQNVDQSGNFVPVKSVKLRIYSYGCSAHAHWAYGLFTAKMIPGVMQVDACGDEDIHLSVPVGFLTETYEWHFGYDSADAIGKIYDLSMPVAGVTPEGQNGVFLDRDQVQIYPYYRCEMKSYTGVPFIYEAHIKSYYLEPGFTFEQQYDNCDLTVQFQDTSHIYAITPPTTPPSQGGTYDTVLQTTQHIQWWVKRYGSFVPFGNLNQLDPVYTFDSTTVDENGIATIRIAITDSAGLCQDTLVREIQLDLSALQKSYSRDTVYTCEEMLPYVYDPGYFGNTHTWNSGDSATRRVIYQNMAWNGCDSVVDVTLIIRKPKVSVVFDLDYCDEFTTTLTAVTESDVSEYKWNTGENTPSITITTPGNYSVVVVDDEGCVSDPPGTINIPACKPFLNLANNITPSNMDGVNDYFSIPQKNLIKELEFTVFNRNGEVVYHTTNKDFQWNGTENGKLFVGATYIYTLHIVDYEGVSSNHKGSITIL